MSNKITEDLLKTYINLDGDIDACSRSYTQEAYALNNIDTL